jgi:uncharacterized protein (TIRG00374 family)
MDAMTAINPKLTRKTVLLPLIGIVAFFLYMLLFNVDIFKIVATAQTANPIFYSAAILIGFAEVFFYAVTWQALLSALEVKISVIRSSLYTWYGIFMDILIPAEGISGDVFRVYLVNREQNGTSGKTVASVVMQRILGMAINVVILLLGIAFLDATKINPIIFTLIVFLTVVITLILCILLAISWKENWATKIINALIRIGEFISRGRWKQKFDSFREEAIRTTRIFHGSMKEFGRKPKTLILPTFLQFLNWFSSFAVPYLVFLSLGYSVSWTVIFITFSIVGAVKSIPIGIPFEVGTPEITMMSMFQAMNVPDGISATATILVRLITLWLRVGVGFAAQQWVELKQVSTTSREDAQNPVHSTQFRYCD